MSLPILLLALGGVFFAGLVADELGRRTRLPRVTILLMVGMAAGKSGLDILPPEVTGLYDAFSVIALAMVAFLLGGTLTPARLSRQGRAIMVISLSVVIGTIVVVSGGLWLMGVSLPVALLLGGIATATDPAATEDALRQAGARGFFADRVRGIVAVDDAWGIIAFALLMVLAIALGMGETGETLLLDAAWEIGGGIAVGALIGLPGAYLTGRISAGDPLRTEALGMVFLTAGAALWLEVSYLLAGMTAGACVASLARHHTRCFHEIEHIEWPFIILFFILAGASFDPAMLVSAGLIGVGYSVFRILGRAIAGYVGGRLSGLPGTESFWYGPALLPQAGIAVGMALAAGEAFPADREAIIAVAVGTTILFELIGPWLTILASRKTADAAAPGPSVSPGT